MRAEEGQNLLPTINKLCKKNLKQATMLFTGGREEGRRTPSSSSSLSTSHKVPPNSIQMLPPKEGTQIRAELEPRKTTPSTLKSS